MVANGGGGGVWTSCFLAMSPRLLLGVGMRVTFWSRRLFPLCPCVLVFGLVDAEKRGGTRQRRRRGNEEAIATLSHIFCESSSRDDRRFYSA